MKKILLFILFIFLAVILSQDSGIDKGLSISSISRRSFYRDYMLYHCGYLVIPTDTDGDGKPDVEIRQRAQYFDARNQIFVFINENNEACLITPTFTWWITLPPSRPQ